MNIPRKHHYLPQVHINKFRSNDGFHVFQKEKKQFLPTIKDSLKIFAIRDLNSTINELTGKEDHELIENELAIKWDDNFNFHFENIINYINAFIEKQIEKPEIIQNSIDFFFEYAVLDYFRALKIKDKKNTDTFDWLDGFTDIKEIISSKGLMNEIESCENKIQLFKGINHISETINNFESFIEKLNTLKYPSITPTNVDLFKPTSCSCDIIISNKQCFILPDCSSIIIPSKETFNYHNIAVNKISCVGIPLSPNIFLQIKNNEVCKDNSTQLYFWKENRVRKLNEKLFKSALKQILCREETKAQVMEISSELT